METTGISKEQIVINSVFSKGNVIMTESSEVEREWGWKPGGRKRHHSESHFLGLRTGESHSPPLSCEGKGDHVCKMPNPAASSR